MKKYPKHIVLPSIMTLYFIVMTLYSMKLNQWKFHEDFWQIFCMEVIIILALFFSLRYLHKKRERQ